MMCLCATLSSPPPLSFVSPTGKNKEHVVGGQTFTVSAVEPSRVPHAFKVLWGPGQPEPAKWYPGVFPGDAWELVFKVTRVV